LSRNWYTGSF